MEAGGSAILFSRSPALSWFIFHGININHQEGRANLWRDHAVEPVVSSRRGGWVKGCQELGNAYDVSTGAIRTKQPPLWKKRC